MTYSANLLPSDASKWALNGASLSNGLLTVNAGGSAAHTFTAEEVETLYEQMRLSLSLNTFADDYIPRTKINIYLANSSGLKVFTFFPVQNLTGAYQVEFDIPAGIYTQFSIEFVSDVTVTFSLNSLQLVISDVRNQLENIKLIADEAKDTADSAMQAFEAVSDLATQANEKATTAEQTATDAIEQATQVENKAIAIQKSLAVFSGRYIVGDKSPTYNLLYADALEMMINNLIYVPTETHTESYVLVGNAFVVINSATPVARAGASTFTIYDAGLPSSNRTGANIVDSGSLLNRVSTGNASMSFVQGKSYMWLNGNWVEDKVVSFNTTYADGVANGDLWYCSQNIANNDIVYLANTLYVWTGIWNSLSNLAQNFVNNNISMVKKAVASITADVSTQAAAIEALVLWQTDATNALVDLDLRADDDEANLETLLTWMGDDTKGAIKAIIDVTAKANANESAISVINEWKNVTIESIASLESRADSSEALIDALVFWHDSVETDVASIASISAKANANESAIALLNTWKDSAVTSIASLETRATEAEAAIDFLVTWQADVESDVAAISTISAKANANEAAINILNLWKTDTSLVIASLETHATDADAAIELLTAWKTNVESDVESIAAISTKANANEAAIGLINTWKSSVEGDVASISSINTKANDNAAAIGLLNTWKADAVNSLTSLDTRADTTESSVQTLTMWSNAAAQSISSLGQTSNAQQATLSLLTTWKEDVSSDISNIPALESEIAELSLTSNAQGAMITAMVIDSQYTALVDYDRYTVGETSPTNAYTYDTAHILMSIGMIYVPTVTHSESFVGNGTANVIDSQNPGARAGASSFTTYSAGVPGDVRTSAIIRDANTLLERLTSGYSAMQFIYGKYYTWNGASWETSGDISLSTTYFEGTLNQMWYCSVDITEGEYTFKAGTLYVWSGLWVAVSDICDTYNRRAMSFIRIDLGSIEARVSTSEGTIADVKLTADDASASIALLVTDGTVSGSAIIQAINGESVATITANRINLNGAVTANNNVTIGEDGKITALGANITGALTATSLTIEAAAAQAAGLATTDGTTNVSAFTNNAGYKDESGVVTIIDGRINADYISAKGFNITNASGFVLLQALDQIVKIGSFTVGRDVEKSYIYSLKATLSDTNNGVYIGTDGIALGANNVFSISSNGYVHATDVYLSGEIVATSGTIGGCSIVGGVLTIADANISELSVSKIAAGTNSKTITFSGNITCSNITAEGGKIGSASYPTKQWTIGNNENKAYIYSGIKNQLLYVESGVYIGTDGISLGSGDMLVLYANGALTAKNATIEGTITATNSTVTGVINATSGIIGNAAYTNYIWNIGNTSTKGYIYNNKSQITYATSGVYIGTDGISLGAGDTFVVTSAGAMTAKNASITGATVTGTINAVSGTIGSASYSSYQWLIGNTSTYGYIRNGKTSFSDANAGVYIGTNGISLGAGDNFKVTKDGALTVKSGVISVFSISTEGLRCDYNNDPYIGTSMWSTGFGAFNYNYHAVIELATIGEAQVPIIETITSLGRLQIIGSTLDAISGTGYLEGTYWYCNGSVINASDARLKHDITELDDKYSKLFDNLKSYSYKLNAEEDGPTHTGFVAQQFLEALRAVGLSESDFAAYSANKGKDGMNGIIYTEIVPLCVRETQKLKQLTEQQNYIITMSSYEIQQLKQEVSMLRDMLINR